MLCVALCARLRAAALHIAAAKVATIIKSSKCFGL